MKSILLLILISVLLLKSDPSLPFNSLSSALEPAHDQPILLSFKDEAEHRRIHVMNANGSNLKILTAGDLVDADQPQWSPDGTRIAFVASTPEEVPISGIYVMKADGTGRRRITNEQYSSFGPIWSPDGKKILLECADVATPLQSSQICTVNSDGSSFRILTSGDSNSEATWSWDGRKIAFVSFRDKKSEIYVMNADGSEQTRLTMTSSDTALPVWSPDGRAVLFTAQEGEHTDIYRVGADGSELLNLTNDGLSSIPVWSPDGQYVAFNAGFGFGIMKFSGATPTIVHSALIGGGAYYKVWSPDSTRLAFVSHMYAPSSSSIYILPVSCILKATDCTIDSATRLWPKTPPSEVNVTDWPSSLNWAYSPALCP